MYKLKVAIIDIGSKSNIEGEQSIGFVHPPICCDTGHLTPYNIYLIYIYMYLYTHTNEKLKASCILYPYLPNCVAE